MQCKYVYQTKLPVSAGEAFDWHMRDGAFERLRPPWVPMKIVFHEGVRNGGRVRLQIGIFPIVLDWLLEHDSLIEGKQFRDKQIQGPFKSWEHTHRFTDESDGCLLTEDIGFELPAYIGVADALVRCELNRLFAFRAKVLTGEFTGVRS